MKMEDNHIMREGKGFDRKDKIVPRETVEDIKTELQRAWTRGEITEEDWDRIKLMFDAPREERVRLQSTLFNEGLIDEEINDRLNVAGEARGGSQREVSAAERKVAEKMVAIISKGGVPNLSPSEMEGVLRAYGFSEEEIETEDPLILVRKLRERLEEVEVVEPVVPPVADDGEERTESPIRADEEARMAGGSGGVQQVGGGERDQEIPIHREGGTERAAEDFSREAAEEIISNAEVVVDGAAPDSSAQDRGRIIVELKSEKGTRELARKIFNYLKSGEFAWGLGIGAGSGLVKTGVKAAIVLGFGGTLGVGIAAGVAVGSAAGALAGALTGGVKEYISERRKVMAGSIVWQLTEGAESRTPAERAVVLAKAEEAYKKGQVSGSEQEFAELAAELRATRTFLEVVQRSENTNERQNERILSILKIADGARKEVPKTRRKEAERLINEIAFGRKKIDRQKVTRATLQGAAVGALGGAIGGGVAHWISGYFHGAGEVVAAKAQAASEASAAARAARAAAHEEFLNKKMQAAGAASRRVLGRAQSEILDQKFKAVVEKGDGATHIARKIAHDYLVNQRKLHPDFFTGFSKEHEAYIEDTLQKKFISKMALVAKHGVRVGDEFTLSGRDVADAMEKAIQLDPAKLGHMSQLLEEPGHRYSSTTIEKITNLKQVFDADNHFANDVIARARDAAAKAAAQVVEVVPVAPVPPPLEPSMGAKILRVVGSDTAMKVFERTALVGGAGAAAFGVHKVTQARKRAKASSRRGGHAESVIASLGYGAPKRSLTERLLGSLRGPGPKNKLPLQRELSAEVEEGLIRGGGPAPITLGVSGGPIRRPAEEAGEAPRAGRVDAVKWEASRGPEPRNLYDFRRLYNNDINITSSFFFNVDELPEAERKVLFEKLFTVIETIGADRPKRPLKIVLLKVNSTGVDSDSGDLCININDSASEMINFLRNNTDSALILATQKLAREEADQERQEPPTAVPSAEVQAPQPAAGEDSREEERTEKPEDIGAIFNRITAPYQEKKIIISTVGDSERAAVVDRFSEISKIIDEIGVDKLSGLAINFFKPVYGGSGKMFVGNRKVDVKKGKRKIGVRFVRVLNVNIESSAESIKKFIQENVT